MFPASGLYQQREGASFRIVQFPTAGQIRLSRARYYDPATAEFTSQDPLEYVDGMSLFRGYFVPRGVDPSGLCRCTDDAVVPVGVTKDGRTIYHCKNCGSCHYKTNEGTEVPIECPPDRSVDPTVDVKTYDCYGLAFRTYEYSRDLAEVKKKLSGCSTCVDGKCKPGELRCLLWVFDARIDYPIGPKDTHPNGGSEPQIANDSFHIVCATEGELACSKNANGPVSPPGRCESFAPKPSDIAGVPKGGVVTLSNVNETCHCCKQ